MDQKTSDKLPIHQSNPLGGEGMMDNDSLSGTLSHRHHPIESSSVTKEIIIIQESNLISEPAHRPYHTSLNK